MSKRNRRKKQTIGAAKPKPKPTIFDLHTPAPEPVLVAIPLPGPPPVPPKLKSRDMPPPPIPSRVHKLESLSAIAEEPSVDQFFQGQLPKDSSSHGQVMRETNTVESYEELQVILASEQPPREPFAINLTGEFILEIVREAMALMTAIDMNAIPKESRMEAFDFMNLVRAEIAKVMDCRQPNVTRAMIGPDGPKLAEESGLTDSAEVLLQPGSMDVMKRCAGSLLNLMEKCRTLNLPLKFAEARELDGPQGALEGYQGVGKLGHSTENEMVSFRDLGEGGAETETETLIWVKNKMEGKGKAPRIGGSKDGDKKEGKHPPHIFQSLDKLQSGINSAIDICRSAIAEGAKFETTHKPSSSSAGQI